MAEEVSAGEVEQSAILSGEEVAATLSGEGAGEEEVVLPSDEPTFEMPEKFAGKSAEEIAKSYMELEKFKAKAEESKPEEGGDTQSKEGEEPSKEEKPTEKQEEQYQKYAESLDKNGGLSEAEYAELAEAGYSKEQVDNEIEYRQYKKEKAMTDVLEPLGGGTDKFKEVAAWANESKSTEEVKAFNDALAGAPKLAQQALLKQLYSEFDGANKGEVADTTLHTNSPQAQPSKGYTSETELFADMNNPAYGNDPKFNKAVQEKLANTDREGWSF